MPRMTFDEMMDHYTRAIDTQNWNDVITWCNELIKYNEKFTHVWSNRGMALHKLGQPIDAILSYNRALTLENSAITYSNLGAAYWEMEKAEEALKCLHEAISLEPLAQTYLTLGNIHKHQGHLKKAISSYRKCTELDPNYADGHLVLGMALLKDGQYKEGWTEYEWRWKTDQCPARKLKCPQWAGEDLTNKVILVYGEQGLGDVLQFSRYARVLHNQFPRAKIIVEGRPQLKRLLSTMPEAYTVINCGDKLPHLDYAIPMLTLAGMLTPTPNLIPESDREYFPHHSDVEAWADRFAKLPKGPKVGICWSGLARENHPGAMAIDHLRSTNLSTFAPLANVQGIVFVSLQKGRPTSEIKTHRPQPMTIADFDEDLFDFYDTACCMENCDLIITVDTAVAHAAASIGRPTWLLSRWDGCWRWFKDRTDSPWYPTMRIFSQPKPHDWEGMMEEVAVELVKFISELDQPELDLTLAK
jgi:hypothetical protein